MFNAQPLILCYHAVSDEWNASLAVDPGSFIAQIAELAGRGYRSATFTEAARGPARDRTLAVTFDDGYKSVYEQARPVLEEHGFSATVFVPTALMRGGGPLKWPGVDHWAEAATVSELEPMSVAELRSLVEMGWEIGSHTRTHPRLPELPDDELRRELEESKRECAELTGAECTSLAFPYGDVDDRVMRAAERAGYEAAALLSSTKVRRSSFAKDRVGIYRADGPRSFRIKTSPLLRRLPERAHRCVSLVGRSLRRR
jgi:peptidoglycan/xylan/chitin deacetylase (PgdA/CDA1 family)